MCTASISLKLLFVEYTFLFVFIFLRIMQQYFSFQLQGCVSILRYGISLHSPIKMKILNHHEIWIAEPLLEKQHILYQKVWR